MPMQNMREAMNNNIYYGLILCFGVFLSAISQVILKKSAMQKHDCIAKEYFNPRVASAYFIFFLTTFMSIYAYKGLPLSMGPVLEATSYIYVTVFGVIVFNEKITKLKIISLVMIILGIIISSIYG